MTHPARSLPARSLPAWSHPIRLLRQRGAGLLEVLISLTIGLVILAAVGVSYISSSNLMRQYEDQNELNEPARFALAMLRQHVEMAGYVDVLGTPLVTGDPISKLLTPGTEPRRVFERRAQDNGTFPTTVGVMSNSATVPLAGCDGPFNAGVCTPGNATRHSLRVAFQMVPGPGSLPANRINPSLTAPDNTTGAGYDCTGAAVGNMVWEDRISTTEFFLNTFDAGSGVNISQLSCRRLGGNTAGLVLGVEELVFRYQVAPAGSEGVAAGGSAGRYLTAAQVRNAAANPVGWAGVTAVEICLVMATTASRGAAAAGTVDLQPNRPTCNPAVASGTVARVAGDVRLWKRFTTVANLRNAVYATPH
jgi:type IV pilus assembly protein PilW